MFTHPDRMGQLVREHQRQLITEASECHQYDRPVPRTPRVAARITRRLVAAFAKPSAVPAEAPGH